jgi:hypothetical protein
MDKNNYSLEEKKELQKQLKLITEDDAKKDYLKLVEEAKNITNTMKRTGLKIVNFFTEVERLNTIGKENMCFYDIYYNRFNLPWKYIDNVLENYYKINRKEATIKNWKSIQQLYFGSITIFKPLIAIEIYKKFNPNTILDFTMGWGGRLIGACVLNIPKYIGIDLNTNLEEPYKNMKTFMGDLSKTEIELYFEDAVNFDYSKLDYDMVLTSPPYYNIELYTGTKKRSKKEWEEDFYIPIFTNTFKYLKSGGFYCLNISQKIYNDIAKKILGEAIEIIPLNKSSRFTKEKNVYKEYIYVWKKSTGL